MASVVLGTSYVSMDEWAFSLKELNLPRPDSRGVHRYQIIQVWRDGKLAEYRTDLGAERKHKAAEFAIPAGVYDETTGRFESLHKVGELVDMADALRWEAKHEMPIPEASDLEQRYRERPDQLRRRRKGLSSFGPLARIQRG